MSILITQWEAASFPETTNPMSYWSGMRLDSVEINIPIEKQQPTGIVLVISP